MAATRHSWIVISPFGLTCKHRRIHLPGLTRQQLPALLPPGLFVLGGIITGVVAADYGIGSFTRMGPGFMPLLFGLGLALLGLVLCWQEFAGSSTWETARWRPFIAITLGILAWALLAESTGFFPAAIAQVIITSLALPTPRWRSILVLAAVLAGGGYVLFVTQLGVPLAAVG